MCKFPDNLKKLDISKSDSTFQHECVIKKWEEQEKDMSH